MRYIQRLQLDSNLAGFEIGKCVLRSPNNDAIHHLRRDLRRYDLVYLISKYHESICKGFKNYHWILADVKITLSNQTDKLIFKKVKLKQGDFYNEKDESELLSLGKDLYKESRFYFDHHTRQLGERIYETWIKNSINKNVADEIIVHRDNKNKIIGFVTVKMNNSSAEPVLVKVNKDFVGRGYGRILMNKFLNFVTHRHRKTKIKAHTQLKNFIAISLYQSMGLKISEYNFVYHVYPHGFVKI